MQNRGLAHGGRLAGRATPSTDLNLIVRAASAFVLAMIALAANFLGVEPFALLVALLAVLMTWEWGQVVRRGRQTELLAVHLLAVIGAALLAALGLLSFAMVALLAGGLFVLGLDTGNTGRLSALGVLYVGLPVLALIWIRGDEPFGATAILFMFCVVWAADTGAFAAGRLLGGAKLWPRVSPNKTWAGFLGGIGSSGLLAIGFAMVVPQAPLSWMLLCGLMLGAVAQGGDLGESALKRFCGVKDASELIPGHGGFMDRLDSLVAVAVMAGVVAVMLGAEAPARTLLFGS